MRVGAILIHGLGGTQYDLGSLGMLLRKAGVETHAVSLAGHGTLPQDLVTVRAEQWLAEVEELYQLLQPQYDQLHIIGMCMGALLALLLAARMKHTARQGRLVVLASPVFLDGWAAPWYANVRRLVYWLPGVSARIKVEEGEPYGVKNPLVRAMFKVKLERGHNFHYPWVPLSCVRQVDRLRAWVRASAADIGAPTLIVHAREDELTSLRSAHFLQARIADAHTVILDNSYHMICVDNDREQMASSVLQFLGYAPLPPSRRRPRGAVVDVD
jgi:carboxylesterase